MADKPRFRYEGVDERTGKARLRRLPGQMFESHATVHPIPKGEQPGTEIRYQQFLDSGPGSPDIVFDPTRSSKPEDPRTAKWSYWKNQQMLIMEWGDQGTPYWYADVTPAEIRDLRKVVSPGRFINRRLNSHPYGRAE